MGFDALSLSLIHAGLLRQVSWVRLYGKYKSSCCCHHLTHACWGIGVDGNVVMTKLAFAGMCGVLMTRGVQILPTDGFVSISTDDSVLIQKTSLPSAFTLFLRNLTSLDLHDLPLGRGYEYFLAITQYMQVVYSNSIGGAQMTVC